MALPEDPYNDLNQEEDLSVYIKKMFLYYLSHWKWFGLSLICFLLLGSIYLFITTPQYEIKASILIKDSKNMGPSSMSILEEFDFFSPKKVTENEIEILGSYTLLEQVARNLNLQVRYSQKEGLKTIPLYDGVPIKVEVIAATRELYEEPLSIDFGEAGRILVNGKDYPQNALITDSFGSIRTTVYDSLLPLWNKEKHVEVHFSPLNSVVEGLKKNLTVKVSGVGTSVLHLSMLSPIPQKGEDIINQLIAVYNLAAIADKNHLIGTTLDFIDDRLKIISVDLKDVEQRVQDFKSSQGITDISSEAQLFLESVQKNDLERSQVDIQLSVLKDIEKYVLRTNSEEGTTPATLGISDPTLLELIVALTTVETERAKALRTMKPANPLVLGYDDQINRLKRNILDNIQTLRGSLEITQRKLAGENKRIEAMIQSIPAKERELVDITRQQEIKNQLYIFLLSKREETAISYASTVADSRLIDAARSSAYPVTPHRRVVILIFALLGLLCPVVGLWLRGVFYNKISSKEEIEDKLKAPVVGEVSQVQQAAKITALSKNPGLYAEQIRTLRTNLKFMSAGGQLRRILITSSISGEGKSFLTANLGTAFAAMNKRTVILGFDLRKPGLHKTVGIENLTGLSDYLSGQATLKDIVHHVPQVEHLDIISCGHIPPNPQELLHSDSLALLMEELEAAYEYIIIDTPPLGLVSDARILNRFADVAIYVIRQNYTPKDRLKFINELYDEKQMQNLCVAVNGVDNSWYGYSSYSEKKYYGEYYGNKV